MSACGSSRQPSTYGLWAGVSSRIIIERRQILFDCAARLLRINVLVPFAARDRTVLVGIGRNQARVHRKAFATDQICCDAGRNDALEHVPENIAVMEAFIAGARECRVIR